MERGDRLFASRSGVSISFKKSVPIAVFPYLKIQPRLPVRLA